MVKRHNIVVNKSDGGIEVYPMKQWLRDNPQFVPEGMDPDNDTSHTLRRGLRNDGWKLVEKADQVIVIKPNQDGDFTFANEILGSDSGDEEILYDMEIKEAEEITFGLERDLQKAIRDDIDQLESGLRIIDGGTEQITEAGRVDIMAIDMNENVVVIELKAGRANPEVIAQVLSYMASISEKEKKPVRGILVAGDFHKRVILAAQAIPNLQLKKYSFQFAFNEMS